MDDLASLAKKLGKLKDIFDGTTLRQITNTIALAAKNDTLKEVASDIGGDYRMSGWKVKFGVGYDLTSNTSAVVKGRPAGPWSVLEDGRKGGVIPKRAKKKIIKTPYGPRTFTREHPMHLGKTTGKHTMSHAKDTAQRETPKRVHIEVLKHMKQVL